MPQDFLHRSNVARVGKAGAIQPLDWLIDMKSFM
jgi:hypothetical protein